jgi:hypothetical protein
LLKQEQKLADRLADIVLVEDNLVVSPELELEALQTGADAFDIVALGDDREEEDKDWKLRIDPGEVMVTTLVHEDQIVTEWLANRRCHAA